MKEREVTETEPLEYNHIVSADLLIMILTVRNSIAILMKSQSTCYLALELYRRMKPANG